MKRIFFIIPLVILFSLTGLTQRFYIQGSGGYAFGFLKENMSTALLTAKVRSDTLYDQVSQNESHLFSFGTGGRLALGVGMKLNDYLSLELAGFYNPCKTLKTEASEYYTYTEGGFFFDFNEHHTYKGREFGFLPAVKFSLPAGSLRPYARIGIIFSFISLTYNYEGTYLTTHPMYYPTGSERSTLEAKRSLNLGAAADFGFEITLADRLFFFLEANGSFISYRPKKATYTEYVVNGDDILGDLTTYEKEVVYVKNYTWTDSVDDDSPRERVYITFPFSSLGLSAGLRFNFFQ